MEPASEKIFKPLKNKLSSQAYATPKTMEYENLVRACVIRYYQRNGVDENLLRYQVTGEFDNGFIWMDKLVDLLGVYEKNRDKYPTLNDFMPEIVNFERTISPKKIIREIKANTPRIESISIRNKSKRVDPDITEITLTFDRPMLFKNGVSHGKQGKNVSLNFQTKNLNGMRKQKRSGHFI